MVVYVPTSAGSASSSGDEKELLRVPRPSSLYGLWGEEILLRLSSLYALGFIGRVKLYVQTPPGYVFGGKTGSDC